MKQDFVCVECGQQFEEIGDGKCYACGGEIVPIDDIGKSEPEEYPNQLMEDEEKEEEIPPEEIEDDDQYPVKK